MSIVAAPVSQNFKCTIGDNLIGIHVGGCPRTALYDIDYKLIMPTSLHDFLAGFGNCFATGCVEQSQIMIGECGCMFDAGQCFDQIRIDGNGCACDGKIFHRPQGMNTIIGVIGNLALTDEVVFKTCCNRFCRMCWLLSHGVTSLLSGGLRGLTGHLSPRAFYSMRVQAHAIEAVRLILLRRFSQRCLDPHGGK